MPHFLASHYDYWDGFFRRWRDCVVGCIQYMPEAWWGWSPEDGELYTVTINLSPGDGGQLQSRRCVRCSLGFFNRDYSVMMSDGTLRKYLRDTENWHQIRRHKPLLRAIGANDSIVTDTRHHLSIELNPYHKNEEKSKTPELRCSDFVEHVLLFAAEASKLIVHPKETEPALSLTNIVIVRCRFGKIQKIAGDKLDRNIYPIELSGRSMEAIVFRLSTVEYPDVADVGFVCVTAYLNNLPGQSDLKKIIKETNKIINTKFKQQ